MARPAIRSQFQRCIQAEPRVRASFPALRPLQAAQSRACGASGHDGSAGAQDVVPVDDHWARLVEHPEVVLDTVERLTGHPARPFGQWAREHADAFRAQAAPEGADR